MNPTTGYSTLNRLGHKRSRSPPGTPSGSDDSDSDSSSDSDITPPAKKKATKTKAKTETPLTGTTLTPTDAFAMLSGNLATAIDKIVSDKKPSLAKRIHSLMDMEGTINLRPRSELFSYLKNQTFTPKEICKLLRSTFSGNANKQRNYESILNLKDDDFISFITFDWVAQFGTIEETGFKLTSLISSQQTEFTIADLFTAFDTAIRFISELYSNSFDIIRTVLLEPLRTHGTRYPEKVLHDQIACAIRNLTINEPLLPGQLDPFIEEWTTQWIISSNSCRFITNTDLAVQDYTMTELKSLHDSRKADDKKLTVNQPRLPRVKKVIRGSKKATQAAAPTTTRNTTTTSTTDNNKIDLEGMEGYCFSATTNKECKKLKNGQTCTLKHADEYAKLSQAKKDSILAATKAAGKLFKARREV